MSATTKARCKPAFRAPRPFTVWTVTIESQKNGSKIVRVELDKSDADRWAELYNQYGGSSQAVVHRMTARAAKGGSR